MSRYTEQKEQSAFSAGSMTYLDDMYHDYLSQSVVLAPSLEKSFAALVTACAHQEQSHRELIETIRANPRALPVSGTVTVDTTWKPLAAHAVCHWFESFGHYHATTGMDLYPHLHKDIPEFSWNFLGLSEQKRTQAVGAGAWPCVSDASTFNDLYTQLAAAYTGSVGYEYAHVRNNEKKQWLRERIMQSWQPTTEQKKAILLDLMQAELFEKHLSQRYVGQKRFSLEGAESFIVAANSVIDHGAKLGIEDVVMGMAHRGRLNTMVNILGLPCRNIEDWFQGFNLSSGETSGDVKYHLGYSSDREFGDKSVHITLNFNPSHLESITPVTLGGVRARQDALSVDSIKRVLPILVHGDASFIGQGVVSESLNMAYTQCCHVGGAVHVIINNQIGFTTTPDDSRSSFYCTDIAKLIDAPIFHVNAEDPEAVCRVAQLAIAYRQHFGEDCVIDLVSYRRHGHNEADEPRATNPTLMKKINAKSTVATHYQEKLLASGVIEKAECVAHRQEINTKIKEGVSLITISSQRTSSRELDWRHHVADNWKEPVKTALCASAIQEFSKALYAIPPGFLLQRQVATMIDQRQQMIQGSLPMNWGASETLLFASLLSEGVSVRLVGQDVCRGTFAHRHAVLYDQNNGQRWVPLEAVVQGQAKLSIFNTTLSEFASLGFEYGYSMSAPSALVVWEAQFGDFANGAQVMIDQYLSSAWQKWARMSGLVLLLPHGYEGQGPEHSSARLERFMQLCAQDNMQVCVPSTPAQYFHLLRRQVKRRLRSPLIVISPKSLLRHPQAVSPLCAVTDECFHVVLDDAKVKSTQKITRVILCSGKVYYDLLAHQITAGLKHVALCRLEQLYPFPKEELATLLRRYKHVKSVIWCQEEPYNQGAWHVIQERMRSCMASQQVLVYAGRPTMASPAPGDHRQCTIQQQKLVAQALGVEVED